MTDQLSPAAQAVFDSYKAASDGCYSGGEWMQNEAGQIAAALRAAADQVVVKLAGLGQESAWYLKEIATELDEAQ
jgi:hypothetical protein